MENSLLSEQTDCTLNCKFLFISLCVFSETSFHLCLVSHYILEPKCILFHFVVFLDDTLYPRRGSQVYK